MKKILLLSAFLFIVLNGFAQTIDYSTRQILEREDSRNKLWLPYDYYQNQIDLDGLSGNNYNFWSNALFFDDTLRHTVWVRKHHGDPGNGFMPMTKVVIGPDTTRSYFETKTIEGGTDIPILNRSLAYSDIDGTGDTLVGVQHDPFFNQDTIVYVNRDMGALKKVYFDKTSLGFTRLWNMSPIIEAYGKWWYVGYQPLTVTNYTGYILSSINRGLSWVVEDSILPVVNRFRPEEPCITKAANGDLLVFSRSDIGNFTWISRSVDSGQSWLAPVRAFRGGNHPMVITTNSGVLVVAPSRHIAQNSQAEPLKEMNDTFFYDNLLLQNGYSYYTNVQVSWDNGDTWREYIVDKERAERQWNLPDGASVVELPNGRVRLYWSTGFGGLTANDVADHRYADMEIGSIEGDVRFVGGTSVLDYHVSDPNNGTKVFFEVDSNEFHAKKIGVDKYVLDTTLIIRGKLGIGTGTPVYDFDFISDGSARWDNFQNMRGFFFQNGAGTFIGRIMRNDGIGGMQYTSFEGFGWCVNDPTGTSSTAQMTLNTQGELFLENAPTSTASNDTALYIDANNRIVKRATSVNQLTGSATLDFANTPSQQSSDLTISVTGAAIGDPVTIGYNPTNNDVSFTSFVSSANFVTVRFNNYSGSAVDPSATLFKAIVFK